MVEDRPSGEAMRLVWDANAMQMRPPRPGQDGPATRQFIKGPLPMPWIERAAALPGKALHIALGLWWVSGLCRPATFSFKRKAVDAFGVSPDAMYDALARLEEAGLIRAVRHRGRSPVVTILEAKP